LPALVPAWFSYANRTYHPVSAFVFFWGILCVIQLGIGIPAFRLFNRLKLKGILAYLLLGFFAVYIPAFALCLYQWSERIMNWGPGQIGGGRNDGRGSSRDAHLGLDPCRHCLFLPDFLACGQDYAPHRAKWVVEPAYSGKARRNHWTMAHGLREMAGDRTASRLRNAN
jgi:hypothetical protein